MELERKIQELTHGVPPNSTAEEAIEVQELSKTLIDWITDWITACVDGIALSGEGRAGAAAGLAGAQDGRAEENILRPPRHGAQVNTRHVL
eukprot:1195940-Prorocentrum_minimum.AAC.1